MTYVSPKSGRAVSSDAGRPYQDRMLALPAFLTKSRPTGANAIVTPSDIAAGLALTQHFLVTRVLAPRDQTLPDVRQRLNHLLLRQREH